MKTRYLHKPELPGLRSCNLARVTSSDSARQPCACWRQPSITVSTKPRNNDSLVLEITYGYRRFVLTGDAERPVEFDLSPMQPSAP